MSVRLVVAITAGGICGAAIMYWAVAPASPPLVVGQAAGPAVEARCPPPPPLDVDQLRTVIREELQAAGSRAPQPALAVSTPAPPTPDTAEVKAAATDSGEQEHTPSFEPSQRLVDDGLFRRSWSNDDRRRLRELMPRLTPSERESLERKLIIAANRGELKVNVDGPLF